LKVSASTETKGAAEEDLQPDFGTYHHTTPRGSDKIRDKVKVLFTKAFGDLPFSRYDKLNILDICC
jgi:hypothetical protein